MTHGDILKSGNGTVVNAAIDVNPEG